EFRDEEALVPDLEGVADRELHIGMRPGTTLQPRVMPPRQRRGFIRRLRQERKERLEAGWVETEVRRELPEDRAELLPEPQHARGEEVGERTLDALQLLHMRDVAAPLDG